jgi:hypothetical protein
MSSKFRKYRLDASGNERPVWPRPARLAAMGREHGRDHYMRGGSLNNLSNHCNPTFDTAARQEFQRLMRD